MIRADQGQWGVGGRGCWGMSIQGRLHVVSVTLLRLEGEWGLARQSWGVFEPIEGIVHRGLGRGRCILVAERGSMWPRYGIRGDRGQEGAPGGGRSHGKEYKL